MNGEASITTTDATDDDPALLVYDAALLDELGPLWPDNAETGNPLADGLMQGLPHAFL
jgi:hypothetical protein